MQMNYKSALMQHMIIDFNQSVFMQDLIIVFSQSSDLDQNYINLNRELNKTSRKSCMQNNTAFVYFKHLITKLTNSKLFKKEFIFGSYMHFLTNFMLYIPMCITLL